MRQISRLLIFILLGAVGISTLAEAANPPAQIIVLVGGISVTDLLERDLPFIRGQAISTGAIALLNTRTSAAYSPENCYASLASGARAQAPANLRYFQAFDEISELGQGSAVFRRYYLQEPPKPVDSPLKPAFLVYRGAFSSSLTQIKYTIYPGLIANLLGQSGHFPAIIGAGDSREPNRSSALLAMNPDGIVPAADFTSILTKDPAYPGGVRTDYQALLTQVQSAQGKHPLIFVETGDLLRLYEESDLLEASSVNRWKSRMLMDLDNFLAELSRVTLGQAQLWLISAYPAKAAYRSGNPITFVLTWGDNVHSGLLTSNTTRRAGLVTNQDLVPSLVSQLGLTAPGVHGSPMRVVSGPTQPLDQLTKLNERWVKVNSARSPLLKTYVLSQIIVVILGAITLLRFQSVRSHQRILVTIVRVLCIAETAVPLVLLLTSPLLPSPLYYSLVILVPLALGVLAVLRGWLRPSFALVYLTTAGAIVIDTVLGWGLSSNSILGYDPIGGARFYGIGNEYMGVLIGSLFCGLSLVDLSFSRVWNEIFPLISGLVALVVLGFPAWGANVGGTIAFAAAYTAWILAGRRHKVRIKSLILGSLLILALLSAFAWWDLRFNPTVSHLGRFVQNLANTGISGAWEVFARKLAMNWKLLHYTVWADGLIALISVLALAFWKPRGLAKKVYEQNPRIIRGFWAALVGALAAFIANDSGVVAAATLMIYPSFLLLSIAFSLIE